MEREGLQEDGTLKPRPEGSNRMSFAPFFEKASIRKACAKALGIG